MCALSTSNASFYITELCTTTCILFTGAFFMTENIGNFDVIIDISGVDEFYVNSYDVSFFLISFLSTPEIRLLFTIYNFSVTLKYHGS